LSSKTTVTTRVRITSRPDLWRLLVVYGPDDDRVGSAHVLSDTAITIGREAQDDGRSIALDDPELSRAHARLEPTEHGWALVDLESHNGTFVDATRVEDRAAPDHGSVIRLGSHLLVLQRVSLESARDLVLAANASSELVGRSVAMASLRSDIVRLAPTDTPVLVIGESGVGKELVATELHRLSGRTGDLVPVNAAALPEQLAESELFGHASGAFTGASGRRKGLFEEAERGTLFIDEIGEMPIALQPKLLRALATGEVRAVGEPKARILDVRVVAATNADLESGVEDGTFRGDLHARLAGEIVLVPPLRDRREDVIELAQHFLASAGGPTRIEPNAAEALMVHAWRYNVRELEQAMRSAASRAKGREAIELDHLPPALREPLRARAAPGPMIATEADLPLDLRVRPDAVPTAEELALVLQEHAGNVKQVAAFFGRHRAQIYRWAERLEVDLESFRE